MDARGKVEEYGNRQTIALVEHEETALPVDVVRPDGTFDLYRDVQLRFEIAYRRKKQSLVIRSGGWVGRIPINPRYTLEIRTRVPVANLERILGRSGDVDVIQLQKYRRAYGRTEERPRPLYDVLTDQFLAALDGVWRNGVAKQYVSEWRESGGPHGRVDPFRTQWLTQSSGRPLARFSAFSRTENCVANRILRATVHRLMEFYGKWKELGGQRSRIVLLQGARKRLDGIAGAARRSELRPESIRHEIEGTPAHRDGYLRALELAELIVGGYGVRLRSDEGRARLPALLVDMAVVFEGYVRGVLRRGLGREDGIEVKDGNILGADGGRREFFTEFCGLGESPWATPDIVIEGVFGPRVVVDVKYKPARVLPDRADLNQVASYGLAYSCQKVMVVYPSVPEDGEKLLLLGRVGSVSVYRASLNLGAQDLEVEEGRFAGSVLEEVLRTM